MIELKKSKKANLESKKAGFLAIGLIASGALVLLAFTFKTVVMDPIAKIIEDDSNSMEEEIIEEMIFTPEETPPPPPQQTPPILEEVEEVDDDIEIEEVEVINTDNVDLTDIDFAEEEVVSAPVVIDVAEVSPEFPGGPAEMQRFIQETFEYPAMAEEMNEQGTVWVQFVVYSDGTIKDVAVVKGVSASLDKEAVRVVKKMPKWKPGEQAGKPVNVRYTIPIKAVLN